MAIITFNFDKQILLPLFFSLLSPLKHFLGLLFIVITYGSNIGLLINSLGLLFAIIPMFIEKRRRKESYKNHNKLQEGIVKKAYFRQITARIDFNAGKLYSFLIIAGLLTPIIQYLELELFDFLIFHMSLLSMGSIFVTVLFCFIMFRNKIFIHKILSLILILISITSVALFIYLYLLSEKIPIKIIVGFFTLIIAQSLREILEKELMNSHFMDLFKIMIVEGVTEGILGLIILTIQLSCEFIIIYVQNQFSFTYFEIPEITIPVTIGMVIISFFITVLRLKSNEIYQPVQRYVFDSLLIIFLVFGLLLTPQLLLIFHNVGKNIITLIYSNGLIDLEKVKQINQSYKLIIFLMGLLITAIVLFGASLYNEIIILHFYGLEKDTEIEITKRAEDDMKIPINEIKNYKNLSFDDSTGVAELTKIDY